MITIESILPPARKTTFCSNYRAAAFQILMCVNRHRFDLLRHPLYFCTKEHLFKAGRSSFA
jgi:hypothetical protein